jgi:hypothetical protein
LRRPSTDSEIEAALADFPPCNNDGIFFIKERGEVIEGLANILEMYHSPGHMLEGSDLLKKWLKDAIASAKKCILNNEGQVSLIDFRGKRCDSQGLSSFQI